LGIYPAIWYLKKVKEFYNLGTQKKLSKTLPMALLVISIITVVTIFLFPLTITSDMGTFYQNLSSLQVTLLVILGIAIFLEIVIYIVLAFLSRAIINEAIESKNGSKKISWFFTLIFGFLYLQYEINRVIDDKEEAPRKAPWIFLIIILILIILGAVGSYLNFIEL
jgi:membrane protease YdiL (CAAX protease family)